MSIIPAVAFVAYSGTGKTTLIEKLVIGFKAQGMRIAVIKHDAHDFEIDYEGKDSWRFTKAGADISLISSARKTAIIERRERTLRQNISAIHDVDLILIEGYSEESICKIGICRKATGKGLPGEAGGFFAVVTDDDSLAVVSPRFALDDIPGLQTFIRENLCRFASYAEIAEQPGTANIPPAGSVPR